MRYFSFGFTSAYNSIMFCCLRRNVKPCCHTHDLSWLCIVRELAWSLSRCRSTETVTLSRVALQSELVGDVAVPVSVRQAVLFWALRSPDARPILNWRRSSSTVLSQVCLGRPGRRLHAAWHLVVEYPQYTTSDIIVTTCEMVTVFHRRPCWRHLACCGVNSRHIGSESRFLPIPPEFDVPVRGFPSEYRHPVWYHGMEKLEWCGGEKNFEDIFIRFDTMHERDRHTDGHRTTA